VSCYQAPDQLDPRRRAADHRDVRAVVISARGGGADGEDPRL
jgi:hypothetical protein